MARSRTSSKTKTLTAPLTSTTSASAELTALAPLDIAVLNAPSVKSLLGISTKAKVALASVAGAGAGVAVGHFALKKYGWKSKLGGAAIGASIPLLYALVAKPDTHPITPGNTAAEADTPVVFVSRPLRRSVAPVQNLLHAAQIRASATGTPGWLGILLAHGLVTQAKIAKYMYKRAHIGWDYKMSKGDHGNVTHPKDRFALKYCEFPPPVSISSDYLTDQGKGNLKWNMWNRFYFKDLYESGDSIASKYRHYSAFYDDAPDRYAGCQLDHGAGHHASGRIVIPSGFPGSVNDYGDMWMRYYKNARWLIWAGEMMRIHSGMSVLPNMPPGWRDHCTAWAIGCASPLRYVGRSKLDMDGVNNKPPSMTVTMEILQNLMNEVPKPGELPSGSEIITPRRLADWAPRAGLVAPGTNWNSTAWGKAIKAKSSNDFYNSWGWKVCTVLSQAAMSCASYAGGVTSGALGGIVGGMAGAMLERGMNAIFTLVEDAYYSSVPGAASDFAKMGKDIADGAISGQGLTLNQALDAWAKSVEDLWAEDAWAWGGDLVNSLLPEDLEYSGDLAAILKKIANDYN